MPVAVRGSMHHYCKLIKCCLTTLVLRHLKFQRSSIVLVSAVGHCLCENVSRRVSNPQPNSWVQGEGWQRDNGQLSRKVFFFTAVQELFFVGNIMAPAQVWIAEVLWGESKIQLAGDTD